MTSLRALIVTVKIDWVGIARLPNALARAGFQINVICPRDALIAYARPLHRKVTFSHKITPETLWKSVIHEIREFQPDILIPGDDHAVRLLHALYRNIGDDPRHVFAKHLLERSLGDPSRFSLIADKSGLIPLSQQAGIPSPETRLLAGESDALKFAAEVGFPIILKPSLGFGGQGVIKCIDENQLKAACAQSLKMQSPLIAQRFVNGQTITVNFVSDRGRLIRSFAVLREQTHPSPFGVSSLVRLIDHPQIQQLTSRITEYVAFSGLGCFQFLIDDRNNQPLLMEVNPRPSLLAYCGDLFGVDLITGLHSILTQAAPPPLSTPTHTRVAIFPYEWLRDPASPNLHNPAVWNDVPWDQPQLLAAIVRHVIRP